MLNRRHFMQLVTATVATVPLPAFAGSGSKQTAQQEPWQTLAAVQQHLLPAASNLPGADDINALAYLQTMMQHDALDQNEQRLIKNGVGWLNDLATKKYHAVFVKLNDVRRETLLRQIERTDAGQRWLSLLLTYLLEALVSDPVYGGNRQGIGWQWLQHQPGFPRPPENKRYFTLQARRKRITKA